MSARSAHGRLACVAAVALALVASRAGAQFTPNYQDTDLRSVIAAIGNVTGRNFLVDSRVRGNVTFLTNTPLSADALYEAFLTMLEMNQFVAIPDGEYIRIVPDATARTLPSPPTADEAGGLVTQVVRVDNVSATQLVPILRPMMSQSSHLTAMQGSNMLVLVDRRSNVDRLLEVIDAIDRDAEKDVEVIRLENAFAGEVVRTLSALAQADQAASGGAPVVQIVADERTNSILLSGPEAERQRYRMYTASLDEPVQGAGDMRVRFLDYADAEDLAMRLTEQFGGAAPAAPGGAPGEAGAAPDEGPVQIWPHPPTNALVINAPSRVMQSIMSIVDQIDIPRAQVQVNAIIVEMSEEKAAQLGVTWAIDGSGNDDAIGLTNFGSTTPGIVQLGAAAQGDTPNAAAIPEGGVFAVGRLRETGTSWAAIVSALRGDGTVNIISEPQILVLDNAEAEQHVGQEVPFRTGEFAQAGQVPGTINPFTTIQREPVGTTLRITPQINEGSGMILTIELEQSSIAPGAQGAADIILNQRRVVSEVFARDGEIIVLGGLIDDQLRQNEQRVPGLGRIPGLGWLFRARNTERVKTNMMMFIRPVILRDSLQRQSVTSGKYEYLRQLQLEQSEEPVRLMREETPPLLPPFEPAPPSQQQTPPSAPEDREPQRSEEANPNDGN